MTLSIELNDEEQRRLDAIVARTGRPSEDLVHEALSMHFEELEEIAWAESTARAWHASDKKTRPFSEVRRELGL
ncbi:DUF6290 family protein [Herbiconiux sp.]|uniref:type II toxin-antitoxin system RelB family antitoxin n=1 Tax=Herbiconiux sp. TaxID=1871186 RepID=UPI0025B995F0|nr:DUF6290 family protein [Herbiconiux sp.]